MKPSSESCSWFPSGKGVTAGDVSDSSEEWQWFEGSKRGLKRQPQNAGIRKGSFLGDAPGHGLLKMMIVC